MSYEWRSPLTNIIGLSLRAFMSSIMRWRSGLTASVLMGNSPE
jgi:hypothetical protein